MICDCFFGFTARPELFLSSRWAVVVTEPPRATLLFLSVAPTDTIQQTCPTEIGFIRFVSSRQSTIHRLIGNHQMPPPPLPQDILAFQSEVELALCQLRRRVHIPALHVGTREGLVRRLGCLSHSSQVLLVPQLRIISTVWHVNLFDHFPRCRFLAVPKLRHIVMREAVALISPNCQSQERPSACLPPKPPPPETRRSSRSLPFL